MPLDYDDDPPTGRTIAVRAGGAPALEQLHTELRGLEKQIKKHTDTSARFQGGVRLLGFIVTLLAGSTLTGVWWLVDNAYESRRVAAEHEIRINGHDAAIERAAESTARAGSTVSTIQADTREVRTIVQSMDNRLERIERGLDGRRGR